MDADMNSKAEVFNQHLSLGELMNILRHRDVKKSGTPAAASEAVPEVSKKVKSRRRKSHLRDARTVEELRRCVRPAEPPSKPLSVYKEDSPSSPPTETKSITPTDIIDLWGSRKRKPALWRDTTDRLRVIFYGRALEAMGECRAFTLNLSPTISATALADPHGFLNHVRRRVARSLDKELGRKVNFFFVVETTPKGRPHLHGVIGINDNECSYAARALRQAAGKWEGTCRQRQLDVKLIWNSDGWAEYANADLLRTARHIPGKLITATQIVIRKADELHDAARSELIIASPK